MSDVSVGRDSGESAIASQRALGQLFGEVSRELGDLVQHEVELAKAQLRQESDSVRIEMRFGMGVIALAMTLLFGSLAAAWGLAELVPVGVAFLLIALLYGVVAAVLLIQNRKATVPTGDAETAVGMDGDSPPDPRIELVEGRAELH